MLNAALQLTFILAGTSYYKAFPTKKLVVKNISLTEYQANFFNTVYSHGLSQFIFENQLERSDIGLFQASANAESVHTKYNGNGILLLQSGGKDSLLLAELLLRAQIEYIPWYISQSESIPHVLHTLAYPVVHPIRQIDIDGLDTAKQLNALNGHVPVTFITLGYSLIDVVLRGKNTLLTAIGHEGEEPHAYIGDFAVTHQWSKTWPAEQLFQEYVTKNIGDIHVGSPLRSFSELKIAKLFVENAWKKYGRNFSSCNLANYKLGHDNSELYWCGKCPKCANSFLLFAGFVQPEELQEVFGANLFDEPSLVDSFKGLLGMDAVMKPFECVGEIDELRRAYELALANGYRPLPFDVPASNFDIDIQYPAQAWATEMIQ